MFPVLLELGPLELHGYGLMVVLGFFFAVLLLRRKCRETGLQQFRIIDAAFWAFLSGLVGARLFFVASNWEEFSKLPLVTIAQFWKGGMVFYGGLIAGLITFVIAIKSFGIPVFRALDIAAPSLALGHAFGRVGCFLAGCCYGRHCDADFPLAVVFSDPRSLAPKGLALHPAQLYDGLNALVIFITLELIWRKRTRTGQGRPGELTGLYLMLYAVGRSIVEEFRGDEIRGFVLDGQLSTSQAISAFMFAVGLGLCVLSRARASQSAARLPNP